MAFTDRELLARIIQCEAGGEGDDGMRAVATVVMNRVNTPTGEYQRTGGGSIRNIVYQTHQFDCAATQKNGMVNMQNVYNMSPEPIHFEIADWAIGGGRLNGVGDCLWFYNPYGTCRQAFPGQSGVFHTKVNLHCFYRPTAHYHTT